MSIDVTLVCLNTLLLIELFLLNYLHLKGVEFANKVIDIVGEGINITGLQIVGGLVAKFFADEV